MLDLLPMEKSLLLLGVGLLLCIQGEELRLSMLVLCCVMWVLANTARSRWVGENEIKGGTEVQREERVNMRRKLLSTV